MFGGPKEENVPQMAPHTDTFYDDICNQNYIAAPDKSSSLLPPMLASEAFWEHLKL